MKVQVFHLSFKADAAGELVPIDTELYALADRFAREHMLTPVDFKACKESWVACEVDGEGKPVRALGLACMVLRPDFVVCRFTDNAAVVKLMQRANDYLHDAYGARGTEALIYISTKETAEQKMCPNYLDWIKVFDLKPADRWVVTVR